MLNVLNYLFVIFWQNFQGLDDQKTLSDCKFNIGDYLDIAITPPTGANDRWENILNGCKYYILTWDIIS